MASPHNVARQLPTNASDPIATSSVATHANTWIELTAAFFFSTSGAQQSSISSEVSSIISSLSSEVSSLESKATSVIGVATSKIESGFEVATSKVGSAVDVATSVAGSLGAVATSKVGSVVSEATAAIGGVVDGIAGALSGGSEMTMKLRGSEWALVVGGLGASLALSW